MAPAAPRDLADRIADTLDMLDREVDAWVATAGPDGPWIVPLSFTWDGARLVFATDRRSRTVRNLEADPRVRVCLGSTRDVVVVDAVAEVADIATMTDGEAADFGSVGHDPRDWATAVVRVEPDRVQAWREENELAGRTIMRAGRWMESQAAVLG